MDRTTFETRLGAAAVAARDFARTLVVEPLPDPIRFRVFLSRSYDAHAKPPRERVYEGDRDRDPFECSLEELVGELYRDGRVPEWVNLAVSGENERTTFVTAECCGRFTDDDSLLYYEREGLPSPFQVLGPPLPVDHRGERYSLHDHATCMTPADVADLPRVADRIRFLAFHGAASTTASLSSLPRMPHAKVLEVSGDALEGSWLAALPRSIAHLRFFLRRSLTLQADAIARPVESLSVSAHSLTISGPAPRSLTSLTISVRRLEGTLDLPETLESLSLSVSGASPEDLTRWLRPLRALQSLSLTDTTVDAALAHTLITRLSLRHLGLSGTRITEDELRALTRAHPGVRITPRVRV